MIIENMMGGVIHLGHFFCKLFIIDLLNSPARMIQHFKEDMKVIIFKISPSGLKEHSEMSIETKVEQTMAFEISREIQDCLS